MTNYYYRNPADDLKRFFSSGSALSVLILVNIAIWALIKIASVFFFLGKTDPSLADEWFLQFFSLPAYFPSIIAHPWTLITYMFLHLDFFHILFNMLWLFWFGKIFMEYLNARQLVQVYFLGGLSGGLLYIIAFNFFPVFQDSVKESLALGASASVMAIVTAISFYIPHYTIQLIFFGRVKIVYLAVILFVIDFFSITGGNAGGHLAHIGGAIFGYTFALFLHSKKRSFAPTYESTIFNWVKKIFSFRMKQEDKYSNFGARPKTDEEYNAEKLTKQKKIDSILEKISRGGYDSLTKEEKEFLFKSSGKK